MSAERVGSPVAANRRSAHPDFPGVPWWGAILIATITTAVGCAFSSSAQELSTAFASMYVLGCVVAVLAVQQAGIFTAIIQPPLILFVAVPGSYFVFHGAEFTGLKDTLINYGYPLIERFPLMFFTAAAVLLIGLVRWYFASSVRPTAEADTAEDAPIAGPSAFAGLAASVKGLFNRAATDDSEPAPTRSRRKHSVDRSADPQRRVRTQTSGERSSRSRHARPPIGDEPPSQRPRRRPAERRGTEAESRKPREPREPGRSSRSSRRETPASRDTHDRGSSRGSRFEDYESERSFGSYRNFDETSSYRPRHGGSDYERTGRDDRSSRDDRDRSSRDRDSSAHHPVSRVRYRGADKDLDDRAEPGQSRFESRPRRSPDRSTSRDPDWRYDR